MLNDKYNPSEIEEKIYQMWESSGYFTAHDNKDKPKFSIILPPPNVTGVLHMGHVLDLSTPDAIIRWKRMQGFDTLWVPGMDHAGIATQNVVERMLAKNNQTKEDLGKEKFLETVWQWKEQYGGTISKQFRRLGASLDWSRERFTMDEKSSHAVRELFKKLYDDNLIYKGEYMVNWCPRCKTALADDEIDHKEHSGHIWYISYPVVNEDISLTIATTRPETMLGDVAIAVNPEDDRYRHLIGKKVLIPIVNREIPIIGDSYVDMEFGSGALKITPAHDPNDFEIGKKHNLEIINIFTQDAKINNFGGKYEGLDRNEARAQIVKDLDENGYLVKIEKHQNSVGHCYRCDTVIEPRVSEQWFISMKPLAKKALEVVKNSDLEIEPKKFVKIYNNWLENIHDWCISRQIWWGHRIPAYYTNKNELIVATSIEQAKQIAKEKYNYEGELRLEQDVLDTWFSSALWPLSTLGWPNENSKDLKAFFPTSVLISGADIIFFWIARMIMFSLYLENEVPFKKVYLHGLVRDEIGRKMSKSLNNSPDTLKLIDTYGADAIRFSILYNTSISQDVFFNEKMVEMGSNFANKIWNASKFVLSNLEGFDFNEKLDEKNLQLEDKYILTRLNETINTFNDNMEKYNIDLAAKNAYEFFKSEFCDWYIEIAKTRVYGNEDEKDRKTAQWVLRHTLDMGLRLLHPFMPFVTEKIWQNIRKEDDKESIMISKFPEFNKTLNYSESIEEFIKIKNVVVSVRNMRAEAGISVKVPVEIILKYDNEKSKETFKNIRILEKLTNVTSILDANQVEIPKLSGFRLAGLIEVYLPLKDYIDLDREKAKLEKEKAKIQAEYDRVVQKLNNPNFLSKAPEQVLKKEEGIKQELFEKLNSINENIQKYS